jgi:hypothetical protein
MNRLETLILELSQTNQRLQQLETEYESKPNKGEIYHKTLKHLRKKKTDWEDKIRNFGKAYNVSKYSGVLVKDGIRKEFEITLVDITQEEAKRVVEMESGGRVLEMISKEVDLLNLKLF